MLMWKLDYKSTFSILLQFLSFCALVAVARAGVIAAPAYASYAAPAYAAHAYAAPAYAKVAAPIAYAAPGNY